jgi:hypothetical protein
MSLPTSLAYEKYVAPFSSWHEILDLDEPMMIGDVVTHESLVTLHNPTHWPSICAIIQDPEGEPASRFIGTPKEVPSDFKLWRRSKTDYEPHPIFSKELPLP